MATFTGKLNLLKMKNSCVVTVKGARETKRGVFIPIDDNNIFISADENLKAKGAYIDFTAWENKSPGKYGDTHSIRQSLAKEVRDRMTEEQLNAVPYIGNMKPFEVKNMSETVNAPATYVDEDTDDLPF